MTKIVQLAGGIKSEQDALIGEPRELTVDTDSNELRLHDGVKQGGFRILSVNNLDIRYQAADNDLLGLSNFPPSGIGFPTRRAEGDWVLRDMAVDSSDLGIRNANGVNGNPIIRILTTLTKNHIFTGMITFTERITASGGMIGNLTGNVTGDSNGTHTGQTIGNVVGNLNGNAVGSHSGDFIGDVDVSAHQVTFAVDQIPLAAIQEDVVISGDLRLVPTGAILMWSGTVASIPEGWVLCDGNNLTPDLRDRFIWGAGDGAPFADPGDTGGTLTHNHDAGSLTASSSGSHSHVLSVAGHALTVGQLPAHAHVDSAALKNSAAAQHGTQSTSSTWRVDTDNSTPEVSGLSSSVGGDETHTHGATSDVAVAHAHTIPITAEGHTPPYYALAFIMKT